MFKEFDNYLQSDFSEDYWSDVGICFAEKKLEKFSDEDWLAINKDWKNRDNLWLMRCTDALGEVENPKSLELLVKFMEVDDVEVKIATLDSVSSLFSLGISDKDINMFCATNSGHFS